MKMTPCSILLKSVHLARYAEAEQEHINDNVSVEQLAGLIHYNPNYFIRFFKSKMKMTPVQYIIKVGIEKTKGLLMTTDLTLEIGRRVGMEVHYLCRVFKQFTNMSPGNSSQIMSNR